MTRDSIGILAVALAIAVGPSCLDQGLQRDDVPGDDDAGADPYGDDDLAGDDDPWNSLCWYTYMDLNGIAYDRLDGSHIPTANLAAYEVVIIPSAQFTSFNVAMNTHMDRFEGYVAGGGKLIPQASTWVDQTAITVLPFGASATHPVEATTMVVVNPGHPINAGIQTTDPAGYASFGYLSNYGSAEVLTTDELNRTSSYIVYTGGGAAYVSELNMEWGINLDLLYIGHNVLEHLLGLP